MSREFFAKAHELSARDEPFAVATVVKTEGSVAAKPGAKVIISAQGEIVFGWIGGGCAESLATATALDSLKDGQPRLITIDLTDELSGMPCGGTMTVYVEPVLPTPHLLIIGHGAIAESLAQLAQIVGFRVTVDDPLATPERFSGCRLVTDDLDFSKLEMTPHTHMVIATQHKSDHLALKSALEKGARSIALIASRTRAGIILDYLRSFGFSEEQLKDIRAPAGLDLKAVTPQEIALSVISEIVALRRGGTGVPLHALTAAARADTKTPIATDSARGSSPREEHLHSKGHVR
uniref:Xanthine and CO dehydrogenases maturation factor n=2 Tax=Candidatus Bipolaricaulota TaxID=67810 RepID=H5SJ51_9BACT|nr:xanthine and CO dehydrogenases maturation factor [uncultured Acetothermia bacterium]BAL59939.1 xanthine and CO dehydrogenases maturation factor [Candidatus Acetothermum autotrophicum]